MHQYIFLIFLIFLILSFYSSSLQAFSISGTVFEDLSGDLFADGDHDINNASGDQLAKHGVRLLLYRDGGDGSTDSNDTLIATTDTDTLENGRYTFSYLSDGRYYVIVDSTTMPPEHSFNPSSSIDDVWAEQTYGPIGALCDDGNGTTIILTSAGAYYGGRRAGISDRPDSPATAEHIATVDINGSDIYGIDFGFSFCVVTHEKDNDDDITTAKSAQGSLRQFIQNANALAGKNVMRFVPRTAPNAGRWWRILPASKLPVISDSGVIVDGTAYNPDGTLRDENPGSVGSGGLKLGTGDDGLTDTGDEPTLEPFAKKELEIDLDHRFLYGLKVAGNGIGNVRIANLAIFGTKDDMNNTDYNADILVSDGIDGIEIDHNFIGMRADGSIPTRKSDAHGIVLIQESNAITNFVVHHNYVGYIGGQGIWPTGSAVHHGEIYQNEVFHANRLSDWQSDAISPENGASYITIYKNYAHDNNGLGFDSWEARGNIT